LTNFVGLCWKVYWYRIDQVESSHNKANGVSLRNLTIEHGKNVLLSGTPTVVEKCLDQEHTK